MKRFFTLLFAASCLIAVGQVPDYVPADGLVAWYPLDGNGLDAGPSGLNGTEYGSVPTDSRNGEANAAILLDGESYINLGDSPSLNPEDALTFSAWFRLDVPNAQNGLSTILGRNKNESGNRYCYSFGVEQAEEGFELRFGLENDANGAPVLDFNAPAAINLGQWHHYVATYASTSGLMKVYLDGMFVNEWNVGPIAVNQILTPTLIGFYRPNGDHSFTGAIDDLGVWNRALVDDEILTLFAEGPAVFGCTDSSACNFNAEANLDDGSCHFLCQYCKVGTVWDEAIQGCVVANPADINLDGCVQLNDLLDLLSAYGLCLVWQCGDPLEYQGYDYATVQIGEQCWFAENLRTESYRNGDLITADLDNSAWSLASDGASAVYGEGEGCVEYAPNIDACNASESLQLYGRHYNGHAAIDPRGVCPTSWRVPTDNDWYALTTGLGDSLTIGAELKAEFGWIYNGNGSDSVGFGALPAGLRRSSGNFDNSGHDGGWWSSTLATSETAWNRDLSYGSSNIERYEADLRIGFSVRCIKDTE